ncbi:MAG: YkgJ family cysteine cluster protein [Thermoguttaceae bacterium]
MRADVESTKKETTSPRPWYTNGLAFECEACGGCCGGGPGFVWVTEDEITALAAAMQTPRDVWEKKYVRTVRSGRKTLRELDNYDCCLLRVDGGCSVYLSRPLQCRTWPFWPENIASKSEWKSRTRNCPGCGNGRTFTEKEIDEISDSIRQHRAEPQ